MPEKFKKHNFAEKGIYEEAYRFVFVADGSFHLRRAGWAAGGSAGTEINERTANPDALFYQDPFMIPDIIDAVQHRKRLCREYKDLSGVQNIAIDRDFSGAGELDFVAHLFGHIHSKNDFRCRKSDGTEYDILMLGESAIGWPGTALNRIYIEEGTINDISFSALHVDVQEKAIYRVSYGAFRHYDNPSQARSQKIVYRFGL